MNNLNAILFDVLMTPIYMITNLIGIIMLVLTVPIWGFQLIKWVMGKGTMRDWYNTIMKCCLVTWTMTDNEYYKDFVSDLCESQYRKVEKQNKKLKKTINVWMDLVEEKQSIV